MKMSVNWELMARVDENHNVLAGMMRGRAVSEINRSDIVRQINVHNEEETWGWLCRNHSLGSLHCKDYKAS